jgi:hypothetical protein
MIPAERPRRRITDFSFRHVNHVIWLLISAFHISFITCAFFPISFFYECGRVIQPGQIREHEASGYMSDMLTPHSVRLF